MSRPVLTTSCDKCDKKDSRSLDEAKAYAGSYVYINWLPEKWALHNTQDGDGPEPDKVFVLCSDCEHAFKLSIRDFQPPKGAVREEQDND